MGPICNSINKDFFIERLKSFYPNDSRMQYSVASDLAKKAIDCFSTKILDTNEVTTCLTLAVPPSMKAIKDNLLAFSETCLPELPSYNYTSKGISFANDVVKNFPPITLKNSITELCERIGNTALKKIDSGWETVESTFLQEWQKASSQNGGHPFYNWVSTDLLKKAFDSGCKDISSCEEIAQLTTPILPLFGPMERPSDFVEPATSFSEKAFEVLCRKEVAIAAVTLGVAAVAYKVYSTPAKTVKKETKNTIIPLPTVKQTQKAPSKTSKFFNSFFPSRKTQ